MRILQLTHKPAYPPIDGGCIAMGQTMETLLRIGHTVDVLTMSTFKHPFNEEAYPQKGHLNVFSVDVDLKTKALDGFLNLFESSSYIMARFENDDVKSKLNALLDASCDIIYIESIFWLPYLSMLKASGAPLILRSHNIEHSIWRELATRSAFPKSAYLRLLSRRLRREENLMWQGVDQIQSISTSDSQIIRKHTKVSVIEMPMSVDVQINEASAPRAFQCHHLGAMDWIPNQEGMRWFFQQVWPLVKRSEARAEFHLAGRRMSPEFMQWSAPGVEVHGTIENAFRFRTNHGVLVIPLFSGSGLRIKILEALSEGVPVLATQKAVDGLPAIETSGIAVSDDPLEWMKILPDIWHRPVEGQKMAAAGLAYVQKHFSTEVLDQRMEESLSKFKP